MGGGGGGQGWWGVVMVIDFLFCTAFWHTNLQWVQTHRCVLDLQWTEQLDVTKLGIFCLFFVPTNYSWVCTVITLCLSSPVACRKQWHAIRDWRLTGQAWVKWCITSFISTAMLSRWVAGKIQTFLQDTNETSLLMGCLQWPWLTPKEPTIP